MTFCSLLNLFPFTQPLGNLEKKYTLKLFYSNYAQTYFASLHYISLDHQGQKRR